MDHGRDRANLFFLKYFGVVPEEFDISNNESAVNVLSGLNDFDGLTIIIESVPINDLLLKDTAALNEYYDSMSGISCKYQSLLGDQIEKISSYFKKNQSLSYRKATRVESLYAKNDRSGVSYLQS